MSSELPPVLRDTVKGNRNFKRYHVALAAMVWPTSIGEFPAKVDKDLSIADRVCIENMSLTGLFFISPIYYSVGKRVWIRIRIDDKSLQFQAVIRRATDIMVAEQKFFGSGAQFIRTPAIVEALPRLAEFLTKQLEVTKSSSKAQARPTKEAKAA